MFVCVIFKQQTKNPDRKLQTCSAVHFAKSKIRIIFGNASPLPYSLGNEATFVVNAAEMAHH